MFGCSPSSTENIRSRVETIMGTFVEVKVNVEKRSVEEADGAINAAFEAVRHVDSLVSAYRDDSEVSRINRDAAKQPVVVSPETAEVIAKALETSRKTGGAFDITVQPLLQLWGFAKGRQKVVPPQEQIAKMLQSVGYTLVQFDPVKREIKLQEGMGIDLGGIAKGYAVDRAVKALVQHGIDSAIVNAGGDMYCLGGKTRGKGWRVGVADPVEKANVLGYVELSDRAVVTSGDYQNFFVSNGVRYSHILDPRTGHPCTHGPHSVTVIAKTCTDADALATGAFVMGAERGLQLLEDLPDVEGLIVSGEKDHLDVVSTSGWNETTHWELARR